jgi:hypothetical protein
MSIVSCTLDSSQVNEKKMISQVNEKKLLVSYM